MLRRKVALLICIVLHAGIGGWAFTANVAQSDSGVETKDRRSESVKRDAGQHPFVAGEVIVRFVDSADRQTVERIILSIGGEIVRTLSEKRKTYLIRLSGTNPDVHEVIAILDNKTEVVYAEPNRLYSFEGE